MIEDSQVSPGKPSRTSRRREIIRKSVQGGAVVVVVTGLQYVLAVGTQVILARVLQPADFGALAFASLVAMGFGALTSLHGDRYVIRAQTDVHRRLDNAFTIELLLSAGMSAVVFAIAPPLMRFLNRPELTLLVQCLGLTYVCVPLARPRSLFERDLSLIQARAPMVISQLVGGATGVGLAYLHYGVWSLVSWRVVVWCVEIVILWWITPYRPRLTWDPALTKDVVNFGWPLAGSALMAYVFSNADYYIVGRVLGLKQLGYYWLAFQAGQYALMVMNSLRPVVLAAFSRLADQDEIKRGFGVLTSATVAAYMLPTMVVLLMGPELVNGLLGSKWVPATATLQIFMVLTTVRATMSHWDALVLYTGQTRIQLYMTVYGAVSVIFWVYLLAPPFGIVGAAYGILISYAVGTVLTVVIVRKYVMPVDYASPFRVALRYALLLVIAWLVARYVTVVLWQKVALCVSTYASLTLVTFRQLQARSRKILVAATPSRRA